jgi:predicted GH43/DUF377 family glycosyl hydrolase
MTPITRIKSKLRSYFILNQVDSDHVPVAVTKHKNNVVFVYKNKKSGSVGYAVSQDGFNFQISDKKYPFPKPINLPKAVIVPHYRYLNKKVAFYGDRSINIAFFEAKEKWRTRQKPLIAAPYPLEPANVFVRKDGLLLMYYEKKIENGTAYYSAYLALFDRKKPDCLWWKTENPIWRHNDHWINKEIKPLGAILLAEKIISYWLVENKIIYGVVHAGFKYNPASITQKKLKKHPANPIISPKKENAWEAFNTFNPAALYADNKVHILYRAQGFDYISSFGYASSADGITIDNRLNEPVFFQAINDDKNKKVNFDYMSGGGFGGCEDPRITKIDDKVYMIYVAFDGWSPPRLALTSILLDDFLNHRWLWSKPVFISRPGVVDKSGCLLPEKINGQYVIFHRVFPNIQIDFVDNLNFTNGKYLKGHYEIKVRPGKWDSRKIGAGAPPLKTKDGWLLIYYGVDNRDTSKYYVGAMLLDLNNPTKVLHRTDKPVLDPREDYENSGFKPGIIYPCGAVVVKNQLLVYYGGADSYVCVASADLDYFLDKLKSDKPIHLKTLAVKEVAYG